MHFSLRIKFYPSKFLDKVISVGIIVRVLSEYTRSAILKFLKFTGQGFAATSPDRIAHSGRDF